MNNERKNNGLKRTQTKTFVQMTGEEFLYLQENSKDKAPNQTTATLAHDGTEKHYVYGIAGIAKLFGCSMPTAHRIKKAEN